MRSIVIGHDLANGELRANVVEGYGTSILVERYGSADMERTAGLEDLSCEREQA